MEGDLVQGGRGLAAGEGGSGVMCVMFWGWSRWGSIKCVSFPSLLGGWVKCVSGQRERGTEEEWDGDSDADFYGGVW